MALITSAQTGNFNQTTTWTGGVIPGVGDEARASDTHTITITANTTCDELSNAGTGTFILNGGVTLNANLTHKSATVNIVLLTFSAASPNASTINGNITGVTNTGLTLNAATGRTMLQSGTGTLTINGNVLGGALNSNSSAQAAVQLSGGGTLNITGNLTGGAGNNHLALDNTSTTGTVNVTGTVTGGSGSTALAVRNNSNGTVNITGNCFGGPGSGATGVSGNGANGVVTITGDLTGGAGGSAASNSGRMTVTGSLYASEFASAITGGARTQNTSLVGPFYTSPLNGVNPVSALAWRWASNLNANTFIQVPTNNLASLRNFVTPDNATNFPAASNVRSGVTYGISGALTGTCAVPPAASVGVGVPVDNTTGTAALTPANIWDYALSSASSVAGSVGEKLKKTAIPADIIALG